MKWRGAFFLQFGYAGTCLSIQPPRPRIAPQLKRSIDQEGTAAWVGPFRPSEHELRWWKETFIDPELASLAEIESTAADDEVRDTSGGLLCWLRLERLARALGDAGDRSSKIMHSTVVHTLELGNLGAVWLSRRWRAKIFFCLVGLYGVRLAGRLVARIQANIMASSDILLDAEDKTLANRGAVLDMEGQALLIRFRALDSRHSPGDEGEKGSSEAGPSVAIDVKPRQHAGEAGVGWNVLQGGVKRAICLRCAAGRRAKYAEELSDALQCLEEARDNAGMANLELEHATLVEQVVVLIQARLCDAHLRSLRDGLIRACADLSALSSFWTDKKSADRRMSVIRSFVLGTLVHGQVFGKRAAVEKDQGNMSATELLLERYLRRLGAIQTHLQARPKAVLTESMNLPGANLTQAALDALEEWVDDGMYLYYQFLEQVEGESIDSAHNVSVSATPGMGSRNGDVACDVLGSLAGGSLERPQNLTLSSLSGGSSLTNNISGKPQGAGSGFGSVCERRYPLGRLDTASEEFVCTKQRAAVGLEGGVRPGVRGESVEDLEKTQWKGMESCFSGMRSTSWDVLFGYRGAGDNAGALRQGLGRQGVASRECRYTEVCQSDLPALGSELDASSESVRNTTLAPWSHSDRLSRMSVTGGSKTVKKTGAKKHVQGVEEEKVGELLPDGHQTLETGVTSSGRVMHGHAIASGEQYQDLSWSRGDSGFDSEHAEVASDEPSEDENESEAVSSAIGGESSEIGTIGASGSITSSFVSKGLQEQSSRRRKASSTRELTRSAGRKSRARPNRAAAESIINAVGDSDEPMLADSTLSPPLNVTAPSTAGDFMLGKLTHSSIRLCGRAARGMTVAFFSVCKVALRLLGSTLSLPIRKRAFESSEALTAISAPASNCTGPSVTVSADDPNTMRLVVNSINFSSDGTRATIFPSETGGSESTATVTDRASSTFPIEETTEPRTDAEVGKADLIPGVRRERQQDNSWGRRVRSFWSRTTPCIESPTPTNSSGPDVYRCAQDLRSPGAGIDSLPLALPVVLSTWAAQEVQAMDLGQGVLSIRGVPIDPEMKAESAKTVSGMIMATDSMMPTVMPPWEATEPGIGVPERSGLRSRELVGFAMRCRKLESYGPASSGSAGISRAVRMRAIAEAVEIGISRPPPRKTLRRFIVLALAGPAAIRYVRRLAEHRKELTELGLEATRGLSIFFSEHLWQPCKAITSKVLFRQRSNLLDQATLEDAEVTVRNMLQQFLEDSKIVPEHIRAKAVSTTDMSFVSRQLEKESRSTVRGTISGQIPRILLIQVAFLKKELLQAMQAIDELFQANQVTLLLISVVPAALMLAAAVQLTKAVVQSATSRRLEPTILVHRAMRSALREIERLLASSRGFVGAQTVGLSASTEDTLPWKRVRHTGSEQASIDKGLGLAGDAYLATEMLNPDETKHRTADIGIWDDPALGNDVFRSIKGRYGVEDAPRIDRGMLSKEEAGKLALCLHGLQTMLRQNYYRFEARARRGLEEDLQDLVRGRTTVLQQMETVWRMQRSYPFLRPEGI